MSAPIDARPAQGYEVDSGQITTFIDALFRYAEPGTFITLRAFDQFDRNARAALIESCCIHPTLASAAEAAVKAAQTAENLSVVTVFAPPVCTFSNGDRARGADLANGLTLSVEVDEAPTTALQRLEGLLGPATVVVESGSAWEDPATGELQPKLHVHWRLSEPTRTDSEHVTLIHGRTLAARIVGADPTGKPVVHPLRWPGTWNRKAKPRMARISALNEQAEIHLAEAVDILADAAGVEPELPTVSTGQPQAPLPLVSSAMAAIPNADVHYGEWIRMGYACWRATGGAGQEIWDIWSQKSAKYNQEEQEATWKRIASAMRSPSPPRRISAGTIFHLAKEAGWQRPDREPPPPEDEDRYGNVTTIQRGAHHAVSVRPGLTFIDPRSLAAVPVPERKWIVQDWLPVGTVTALYGDGGTGKTLLTQQLMTAAATGKPWCGLAVERCVSFGLFCQDEEEELHRRQYPINRSMGVDFADLGDMSWASGVGLDNLLVKFDHDNIAKIMVERMGEIEEYAKKRGARLVVLDTGADLFGGNENDRSQVRQFLGTVLGGLARRLGAAVLLNVHPSRSGMSPSGDMDGGSTAWSNTVRSRWSLARPTQDGGGRADPDERILTRRKANYASIGDEIQLRWVNGVLVRPAIVHGLGGSSEAAWRPKATEVFLTLLDRCTEANIPLSHAKTAGNSAPGVFARRSDCHGYKKRDFEQAMSDLFERGAIRLEQYGRPGDERRKIVRAGSGRRDVDAAA